MSGNKQVYKEAFDRARTGKSRGFLQRLLFPFQDHYTQRSREQGEHDGSLAHSAEAANPAAASAPASGA